LYVEQPPTLRCSGDEDRATQSLRRRALSCALQAPADLLVDLSELAWADVSLMVDLATVASRLRNAGRAVRVRGAQPQVMRLIELMGLDRQPGVTVESPALA
jgi:anti-anti-sigma regulatory factor